MSHERETKRTHSSADTRGNKQTERDEPPAPLYVGGEREKNKKAG
jgi:hypothetical protein